MLIRPAGRGIAWWRWAVFAAVLAGHGLVGWNLPTGSAGPAPVGPVPLRVHAVVLPPGALPAPQPVALPKLHWQVPPLLLIRPPSLQATGLSTPGPVTAQPTVSPRLPAAAEATAHDEAARVASLPAVARRDAAHYLVPPVPAYPPLSRRLGETGRVLVRVEIDSAGRARQVVLARSSGFARLDAAALDAVRLARFTPPSTQGEAVAGWTTVPIDFRLEDA